MHADEEELLLESRCLLMTEFIEAAHRAAFTNATILLTGDSGTGKNAFARQIHRWSRRREAPFLSVDCAAIPEHLHESDPFEDLKNTLAALQADREGRHDVSDSATLLLDNLVDLPPAAQARLLQFVEERQSLPDLPASGLRFRIIAASSRDLGGEVAAGHFRSDLFYRINVIALRIPTLVERRLGYSRSWPRICWRVLRLVLLSTDCTFPPELSRRWRTITGPAMSASYETRSSARPCFAQVISS